MVRKYEAPSKVLVLYGPHKSIWTSLKGILVQIVLQGNDSLWCLAITHTSQKYLERWSQEHSATCFILDREKWPNLAWIKSRSIELWDLEELDDDEEATKAMFMDLV